MRSQRHACATAVITFSMRLARQPEIVRYVQSSRAVGERGSSAVLTFDKRSVEYRSVRADQTLLIMRIRDIAQTRMRYGYFRIYILLCREGWIVNHKRVYRLYREDALSLRFKRPRRHVSAAQRERQPAALAPNKMWSMDFVSDALTVVDAHTREALAIDVDQGIKGGKSSRPWTGLHR